jgi:carbamoyltransferase
VTTILGISAFYHDSAACVIVDGEIVAAAQEERFTREKYDPAFPTHAIDYCLAEAGRSRADLDYIAFYDKPVIKFERLLETYLRFAPSGLRSFSMAMPVWLKKKLLMRQTIKRGCRGAGKAHLVFLDHHESHAASAFFPSPFDEAAILTLDGVGEWSTATYGTGVGNKIRLTHQLRFPHSLGLLYSAFTYYCGFKVNSGEYKLMGLAPYGRPVYRDLIVKHLIDLKPDGSLWLDMQYFNYCQGLTMTNRRFDDLFGGPPRQPDTSIDQRHMDLAASVQAVTEEVVLRMSRELHRQTRMKRLVLAGGVALNCVANGRLLREGPYEDIWIQPAAGDAGGALGAALFVWHQLLEKPRPSSVPASDRVKGRDRQRASLLGPQFSADQIQQFLDGIGASYRRYEDEADLLDRTAELLADEKVVGWFHGRAEFGPRALGARSLLGDARSSKMQATMNLKIKFRESFRPFAPCVLREHVHEWFGMRPDEDSPYMLLVAPVLEQHRIHLSEDEQQKLRTDPDLVQRVTMVRSTIPAVTHVDNSARVQTVDERHGRYYRLLQAFHRRTGCPVLVNTSFNLSWEPIVQTPQEAYHTFMQSEMDALVLEDFVLLKAEQPLGLHPWASSDGASSPHQDSPWLDPKTGESLLMSSHAARNPVTGASYSVEEGIPRLFVLTSPSGRDGEDVTEIVKSFYEKTPFPNYDDVDNQRALLEKARAGTFARLLNEQIPYSARVLEVGCGTGQLTNFLAIAHRSVLGVDVCLNSLRLAHGFKTDQGLERATFAQMNLFRPALKPAFFDVVISNGVLHHTSDCRLAFRTVGRLVKPGGHLVVGLYSAYSRKLHAARRAVVRLTGLTSPWLDPHFDKIGAEGKREAWFQDQYHHPHETSHTLDEVLGWMEEDGFDFVNSVPKPAPGPVLGPREQLFAPRSAGTATSRMLSQLANMGSGYREGGFFIIIGQRRVAAS